MKIKKILLWSALVIVCLCIGIAGVIYMKIQTPFFELDKTAYVYIDEEKDYDNLLLQLQTVAHAKDIRFFDRFAQVIDYPSNMKTGRYAVTSDMNCRRLLQNLKNGNQSPCRITFNNMRLKQDFARRIGEQLMFSENDLYRCLIDSAECLKYGFDVNTISSMFIPNTYEMYWNVPVEKFMSRMKSEYDRFWTPERLAKAESIPLNPVQVSILASIVEEETAVGSEYATVAGLYINRLKRGMLLQADPTVKYAVGDFALRRILYIHLATDSPYNTYKYSGLPPGPIRIPSIRAIDSVLDYAKHNYLYMCAKEDFSGRHNFSTNLAEHNRNARRYQEALNRNNIK